MLFSLIARKIARHFISYYDMTCIGSAFPGSLPMLFYIFTEKSARMVSHPDGLCSYLLFLIIFCGV